MKKDATTSSSQDENARHVPTKNLRPVKEYPSWDETADMIHITKNATHKPAFAEDKREEARHEHTNHFTNRASGGDK